jgi:hypothetical protein
MPTWARGCYCLVVTLAALCERIAHLRSAVVPVTTAVRQFEQLAAWLQRYRTMGPDALV